MDGDSRIAQPLWQKEIHKIADLKGLKGARPGDGHGGHNVPAYGAQTCIMPFGSVYTSLQTGLVDFAENGINIYHATSITRWRRCSRSASTRATNSVVWISDKLWSSLSAETENSGAPAPTSQPGAAGQRLRAGTSIGNAA